MRTSVLDLPGPRRFLRRASERIVDGLPVVLALPDSSLAADVYQWLCSSSETRALDWRHIDASSCPGPSATARCQQLLEALGGVTETRQPFQLGDLHAAPLAGRTVWVEISAPELAGADWLEVQERIHGVGKNLPVHERLNTVLVYLGRSATTLTGQTGPMWWWDVLGDVDVLTAMDDLLHDGDAPGRLTRAMIANLSGPDVDLALDLLTGADEAGDLFAKVDDGLMMPADAAELLPGFAADGPSSHLVAGWADGDLGWCGGRPWIHPRLLTADARERALATARSTAQHAVLLPLVERCRQELVRRVEATGAPLPEYYSEVKDIWGLEIDQIADVVHAMPRVITSAERRLAKWLDKVRNAAAHCETVTSKQLRDGPALLADAGIAWEVGSL